RRKRRRARRRSRRLCGRAGTRCRADVRRSWRSWRLVEELSVVVRCVDVTQFWGDAGFEEICFGEEEGVGCGEEGADLVVSDFDGGGGELGERLAVEGAEGFGAVAEARDDGEAVGLRGGRVRGKDFEDTRIRCEDIDGEDERPLGRGVEQ